MSISYRISQFWHLLAAALDAEDYQLAEEVLTPRLMQMFSSMQPFEQAHSLKVYHRLVDAGLNSPDLLAAALLHDVGKSRVPLKPWERALIVVCQALAPNQSRQWGVGEARGWKRPFVVAAKHPSWGAEMVKNAGASTLTASLILRHQDYCQPGDSEEELMLRNLQRADRES